MSLFASVGHVAIRVKDIDKSLAFYCGKLGIDEMFRLHRDNGDLWLVYLRVNDDQYLELFPDAVGDSAPEADTNGLNHYCLTVTNIEETLAALDKNGVELFRPLKMGADGNRQAWVKDPDGNRVELMEMAPDCKQAQAIARWHAEQKAKSAA